MTWTESLAHRISASNRSRKWDVFLKRVKPTPQTSVLDVGYASVEYADTDNFLEKHYPYRSQITALGIDDPRGFGERYPEVKVVRYQGGSFPFGDTSFDVCWSNAVLEHVGSREAQVRFIKEIYRVSRVALVTTPNRFFPVEVHTRIFLLHFLPKRIFDRLLVWMGKGWAAGNYMNLLSERQVKSLIHEAGITKYCIVKNRFALFVMDFVVILKR